MFRITFAAAAVMLLVASTSARADQDFTLWHGWLNLTPCSKLESRPFPELPVIKTGPQELHGYIRGHIPDNMEEATKGALAACAALAVGTAGGTSLITSPAVAWPTFMAAFGACASDVAGAAGATLFNTMRLDSETICKY